MSDVVHPIANPELDDFYQREADDEFADQSFAGVPQSPANRDPAGRLFPGSAGSPSSELTGVAAARFLAAACRRFADELGDAGGLRRKAIYLALSIEDELRIDKGERR